MYRRHVRRGLTEKFLQPHDGDTGLRAVNAVGVPEVVNRRIGFRNTRRVPTAVVKLGREAGSPKEAPRGAVIAERARKDRIRRPARQAYAMRRQKLCEGIRDRHVARTPPGLESPQAGLLVLRDATFRPCGIAQGSPETRCMGAALGSRTLAFVHIRVRPRRSCRTIRS